MVRLKGREKVAARSDDGRSQEEKIVVDVLVRF